MSGPWEAYAAAAPQQEAGPWQQFAQPATPSPGRTGSGVWDALVAGYQSSATGLAVRGRLPDVTLDASHAPWYERAVEGAASTVSDLPEMAAGFVGGGALGTAVAGPVGSVLGAGAGAFAVPTAIRESLIQAYTAGEAGSSADWLSRTGIVLERTGKAAVVGALTAGAGTLAARTVGGALAPLIGEELGVQGATRAIGAAQAAAEVGTMTVAPAALEGRLPEPQDFVNAAILVGGMKAAGHIAGKLGQLYAKTGVTPEQAVADAKADPEIARQLQADTPITDTPSAYVPREAMVNAERALPAVQDAGRAQAFVESPFAALPGREFDAGKDLHPNIDFINTADDAKAIIVRAAQLYPDKFTAQTRGSVSIAEQEAQAASTLAEMVGAKDASLLAERTPGTGVGTTEMHLRGWLMREAVEDFTKRAQAYDPLTASAEDAVRMQAAAERVAMLSANFKGAGSEAGRALNALKYLNAGLRQADAIAKLMEGTPDPAKVAAAMQDVDNPVAAAEVARRVIEPKALTTNQKFVQVRNFALLMGFKVPQVKAIGDGIAWGSGVVDRAVAMGIGLLHGGEKVTMEETAGFVAGSFAGTEKALRVAAETWDGSGKPKLGSNAFGYKPVFSEQSKGGEPSSAEGAGGAAVAADQVISIPHRVIGAETEFARVFNEQGEARALAIRQAIGEDFEPGTKEFAERIYEIEKNPTPERQLEIEKAGAEATFTAKVGSTGKILQAIQKHPIGAYIVPFSTVPANLITWAVKRMPGAAFMLEDVQADFAKGGAPRDIAIARQVVGATVAAAAYGAVAKGILTGGGLGMTPEERQGKIDSGQWQPYSIKVGDTWYGYNRFEPIARIASLAADSAEIHGQLQADDKASLPLLLGAMFGNAMVSQTYLSGLNQFFKALADPAREGPKVFDNFIGSWVPAFLAQTAAQTDKVQRRIDNAFDAVQNRLPYFRNQLLPKVNELTGEPMKNKSSLFPVDVTNIESDTALKAVSRLQLSVPKAPKSIEMPSFHQAKIGKVELTPEQQNFFSTTSGHIAHQAMTMMVESDGWERMAPIVQKRALELAIQAGHKVARAEVLSPEQRTAEARRIAEELSVRLSR